MVKENKQPKQLNDLKYTFNEAQWELYNENKRIRNERNKRLIKEVVEPFMIVGVILIILAYALIMFIVQCCVFYVFLVIMKLGTGISLWMVTITSLPFLVCIAEIIYQANEYYNDKRK
jgi:hypothetical protein